MWQLKKVGRPDYFTLGWAKRGERGVGGVLRLKPDLHFATILFVSALNSSVNRPLLPLNVALFLSKSIRIHF